MPDPNDYVPLTARRLCATCIGDHFLRAAVEQLGQPDRCDYCGTAGPVLSLGALAARVETAFQQHYVRTPTEPSPLQYALGDGWYRDGDPTVFAIAGAAIIDDRPADDIRQILKQQHQYAAAEWDDENPFAEDAHYIAASPNTGGYWNKWRSFEDSLKTEARFFGSAAATTLDDIFGALSELSTPDGKPIIVEAGPTTELPSIFRARFFQSEAGLKEALKRPDRRIGPPPPTDAKANRMNAHGISVFYGATDPSIAISEIRPPVGSHVIMGEWTLLRNISVLDFDALRSVAVKGSVFDPMYMQRLERAAFLSRVGERISRPVMPDDRPLKYIVTQVVAEYLASHSTPTLDGILYPSTQCDNPGSNVMLFHKASRVELMDLPQQTRIDVTTGYHDEDGWVEDFDVCEISPSDQERDQEEEMDGGTIGGSCAARQVSPGMTDYYDSRDTTLRLKLDNLQVHRVSAADFDTAAHRVNRRRMSEREIQQWEDAF